MSGAGLLVIGGEVEVGGFHAQPADDEGEVARPDLLKEGAAGLEVAHRDDEARLVGRASQAVHGVLKRQGHGEHPFALIVAEHRRLLERLPLHAVQDFHSGHRDSWRREKSQADYAENVRLNAKDSVMKTTDIPILIVIQKMVFCGFHRNVRTWCT